MSPSKKSKLTELEKLQAKAKELGFDLKRTPVQRAPGRPPTYDPDFHPEDYVRQAAMGKTKAQICFDWGIHRGTLHEWSTQGDKPELSDAIKRGDEGRSAWYTTFLLGGASGRMPGFQAAPAIFLTKNICPNDFREKIDHTHTLDVEEMEFGT